MAQKIICIKVFVCGAKSLASLKINYFIIAWGGKKYKYFQNIWGKKIMSVTVKTLMHFQDKFNT